LIFGGSSINIPKGLCAGIYPRKVFISPKGEICPRKSLCGLEVEAIEFTINDV
jgi:hypothetical protein